ncbi:hypothetical protein Q0M94_13375 [Deinococcus radiomollis]|uniref:hypothetical protein n=1 Tax=Deinococcus radiomollis TaxID=468916 RepID=UPI003892BEE6
MKNLAALTISTIAATSLATAGAQTYTPNLNNVELGLTAGYQQGLSGGITVRAANVAGPVGVRASVDFNNVSDSLNDNAAYIPGTAVTVAQRKAAGDTESGSSTTVGLDATYDLPSMVPGVNAYVYGGARYNKFSATLDQTSSGSGKVTYTTNQFGLGAGVAAGYAITGNLSLTGDLGVDYYFPSSFSTNTGGVNGTGDTYQQGQGGYAEVDNLVNQPTTSFKAKIGLAYHF